jgi:glucose-1-phosphate thymidylyltransferase
MKGVILAGGTGSRLHPLTKVTNKHLLPVGRVPMIYHPVQKMIQAGIREILVVTGIEHVGDVVNLLGSGREFDCEFTYKVQDEAGGIAQALGLARNFIGNSRMLVILGDNIFSYDLSSSVESFEKSAKAAKILLKQVEDPQRYGVATVQGGDVILIEEKPLHPATNMAVTGIYMYSSDVFDVIQTLKPSGRGELEITDVNNYFIRENSICWDKLDGWWTDAGTFDSLAQANKLLGEVG